jgi:hypothetical protein
MAHTEGPQGQPPAAWVWSQYRGVLPDEPTHAEAVTEAASASADTPPAQNSAMVGVGLAAAVIVITGLTWLFASGPASAPAEAPPSVVNPPPPVEKTETAPLQAAPAPTAAAAPAPVASETAKPAETAPAPEHKKKKKHR